MIPVSTRLSPLKAALAVSVRETSKVAVREKSESFHASLSSSSLSQYNVLLYLMVTSQSRNYFSTKPTIPHLCLPCEIRKSTIGRLYL